MKKRSKLSLRLTLGLILLGVIICSTSCFIGYRKYTTVIQRMYNDTAYQIAYVGVSYLDGDDIERCLNTGTTSEKYEESLAKLTVLRELE